MQGGDRLDEPAIFGCAVCGSSYSRVEQSWDCCRPEFEIEPFANGLREPVGSRFQVGERRWCAHGNTPIRVKIIDMSYLTAEESDWLQISEEEILYVVQGNGGLLLVFEAELFEKRPDAEKIIQARDSANLLPNWRLNY